MEAIKELVLKYFKSWQIQDWNTLHHCLADNFSFDAGNMQLLSADAFTEFCKKGARWSQVQLLDSIFNGNKGSILYEGVTETGQKIRVSEHLQIDKNKIIAAKVAMTLL